MILVMRVTPNNLNGLSIDIIKIFRLKLVDRDEEKSNGGIRDTTRSHKDVSLS